LTFILTSLFLSLFFVIELVTLFSCKRQNFMNYELMNYYGHAFSSSVRITL